MNRKNFIKSTLALSAMASLSSFKSLVSDMEEVEKAMPVLFVGHGSPMNAIEENEFTKGWENTVSTIPTPKAILCISAHWETKGTFVTGMAKPKTIHDFGGFPQALFDAQYPAPGSSWLADEVVSTVKKAPVTVDHDQWGLDHGTWSVLKKMYPNANIPVVQLSLDYSKNAEYHYALAKELAALRKIGVLIVGSGNMVHNFQYANFSGNFNTHNGLDWAIEANEIFKKLIAEDNHSPLINYEKQSRAFQLAAPTPEHYLPMLYAIALKGNKDKVSFFNDAVIGGSFSMTSLKIESA